MMTTKAMVLFVALSVSCCLAQATEATGGDPPFKLVKYSQDHGVLRLDRSFANRKMKIGSRMYEKGLGTHAKSAAKPEGK